MEGIRPCGGCGKSLSDFLDTCPACGHRQAPRPLPTAGRPPAKAAKQQKPLQNATVADAQEQGSRWRLQDFTPQPVQHVLVTDIHMSFGAMVTFLVKLALAAIPAMILLGIMASVVVSLIGAMRS